MSTPLPVANSPQGPGCGLRAAGPAVAEGFVSFRAPKEHINMRTTNHDFWYPPCIGPWNECEILMFMVFGALKIVSSRSSRSCLIVGGS